MISLDLFKVCFHSETVVLNDFISVYSEYFTLKLLLVHKEGQSEVLQLGIAAFPWMSEAELGVFCCRGP